MDRKPSLSEILSNVKDFGAKVNDTVTNGVDIPVGRKSTLNLAAPNWEDPRLRLSVPSSSPFGTNMSFTLGADLNWHQPIKDMGARMQEYLIGRLTGK